MDKKGTKRSLSESSVSIKSDQKQGNANELKKSLKKPNLLVLSKMESPRWERKRQSL